MSRPLSSHCVRFILIFLIFLIQVQGQEELDGFGEGQCPNANKDLSWFRRNAKSLLFMEHLEKRAAKEDLYDWSTLMGSEQYRSRLRSLENQFVMPEEVPEDCYEQMPIPQRIAQRIAFLEDRLESCGSAQPCTLAGGEVDASYAGGLVLRRLSMIQAELMRQRSVIRMMRMRIATINQQCEGIYTQILLYFH